MAFNSAVMQEESSRKPVSDVTTFCCILTLKVIAPLVCSAEKMHDDAFTSICTKGSYSGQG